MTSDRWRELSMKRAASASTRAREIEHLLSLSREDLLDKAEGGLEVVPDLEALYQHLARSILKEIESNNEEDKKTKLILPVGPTGQYPLLAEMINEKNLKLDDCYFFFMDEYCDSNGIPLPEKHPLSFKGEMRKLFFERLDSKVEVPDDQMVFPDEENLHEIPNIISQVGGIDTCYGGIGIHGHVAFNEPEPGIQNSEPRMVYLNNYTVTINAIRADVGGDLVNFPKKALTIGMNQILRADRVRLYCRNDIPNVDWANTVLRLAVLGNPGEDFPVTFLNRHEDYKVVTDTNTAERPGHIHLRDR